MRMRVYMSLFFMSILFFHFSPSFSCVATVTLTQYFFEELRIFGPRQTIPCMILRQIHMFSALYDTWSSYSENVLCRGVRYGWWQSRLGWV